MDDGKVETLVQIQNLRVVFTSRDKQPEVALDGVSLNIKSGELIGILGESGSGKTTLGLSLLGLLPENGEVSGSICLRGCELLGLEESQLEKIRGAEISMIFQEPGLALHPTLCVGEQISDVIHAHSSCSRKRCREEARLALAQVRLKDLRRIYASYPHELSGGERQRVVIARALASHPSLVIADEPTASLDSTVQAEILSLLREINECLGVAIMLVSHNPAVLGCMVSRLLVISAGRIVEEGTMQGVLAAPAHTYTRALVDLISPRPNCCPEPEVP